MKLYRDTHAAHLDIREHRSKCYPDFVLALEAAYFYYDHLLPLVSTERPLRDNLRIYSAKFEGQAKQIAETAMRATEEIDETIC